MIQAVCGRGGGISRCLATGAPDGLASLIQAAGGRIEAFDLTAGSADLIAVADLPDGIALATLVVQGTQSGLFASLKAQPLLSTPEARSAIQRALPASPDVARLACAPTPTVPPGQEAVPPQASAVETEAQRSSDYSAQDAAAANGHTVSTATSAAAPRPDVSSAPGQRAAAGPSVPAAISGDPSTIAGPSMAAGDPATAAGPGMPAAPASTSANAAVAGLEMPTGAYDLYTGPFVRFSELADFSQVLAGIPGVQAVTTRHFTSGRVVFRVRYDSAVPLLTRLNDLVQFKSRVRELGPRQIEFLISRASPAEPEPVH